MQGVPRNENKVLSFCAVMTGGGMLPWGSVFVGEVSSNYVTTAEKAQKLNPNPHINLTFLFYTYL